jgi:IS30 family transposase
VGKERFGDWEIDTIVRKENKGVILTKLLKDKPDS